MAAASKTGSAVQPAYPNGFLPLNELTSRSARIGKWQLGVCHAWEDEYEYQWEGETKTGCCFKCLLVDILKPTVYCHAEFKKTRKNEKSYQAAKSKFTEGSILVFEQIGFGDSVKAQYLTASKREVINLASTKASPSLGSIAEASAVQPCPTGSVADKVELKQNQYFDLTALVKEVSALRPATSSRKVFDVCLIDGSTDPKSGKMQTMKAALFDEENKAKENHALAEKCQENRRPITFLMLQGSKHDEKFVFSSAKKGLRMFEAMDAEKATLLASKAADWLASDNTQAYEQKEFEPKDYSAEQGFETSCKIFSMLSRHESGIAALDAEETVWQMNWLRIYEPSRGETMVTNDGKRLWFPVTVRGQTHHLTLYMTEKAALRLSGHENAESFMAAHEAGTLWFPLVSSLKILRKRTNVKPGTAVTSSAGQPAYTHEFDSYIIDAGIQDLTESPTKQSLLLLDMMDSRMDSVGVFLPAALHMIHKSVHYSMVVHYTPQDLVAEISKDLPPQDALDASLVRPCSQAFALVEATATGEMVKLGDEGYKLVTKGVKDVLSPANPATYTLTAFCTLANLQDFKLDPPRGTKKQTALIVIADVLPTAGANDPVNFIVDSILLVSRDDVSKVAASMKKLLYYTAAATQINAHKRAREWDENFSPAKALTCRNLSRHPTGEELPDYKSL